MAKELRKEIKKKAITDEDFYILGDKCRSCATYWECSVPRCLMCNDSSLFEYIIDKDDRPIGGFVLGQP